MKERLGSVETHDGEGAQVNSATRYVGRKKHTAGVGDPCGGGAVSLNRVNERERKAQAAGGALTRELDEPARQVREVERITARSVEAKTGERLGRGRRDGHGSFDGWLENK